MWVHDSQAYRKPFVAEILNKLSAQDKVWVRFKDQGAVKGLPELNIDERFVTEEPAPGEMRRPRRTNTRLHRRSNKKTLKSR